ncbi:hypothetical protein QCA50_011919 [Cerrena zonata]|uniref:MYND-type domain-containing protein n=1 Tax=Cerrena zonata TaxID=2478898 RepID=A0AAW0G0N0_9APHY
MEEALTRQEILHSLYSMGVELPPATKLPDEALNSRLDDAIKSCQELPDILPSPASSTLRITSLGDWPSGRLKVAKAIDRANLGEVAQNSMLNPELQGSGVDVLGDLRYIVHGFADNWDQKMKAFFLNDPDDQQTLTIALRIVHIKRIDDSTPVLTVLYSTYTPEAVSLAEAWDDEQADPATGQPPTYMKTTLIQQKALLRILKFNSRYVPANFHPDRSALESDFKVSYIFPVGPLSFEALGKLNLDTGCAICGSRTVKKCSQCYSVGYCGPECQKQDWKNHKQSCVSVKGGTWRTIRVSSCLPGTSGMFASDMNQLASTRRPFGPMTQVDGTSPPPNIHGSRVFLIKLQFGSSHLYIYDRKKSMKCFFVKDNTNREVFDEFLVEMQRSPRVMHDGLKMYRWAKREGDWDLSVCLDKLPLETIRW